MGETDRVTLVEKAMSGLRSLIMSGELKAGSRVAEVSVSERLGISRTPLRQALDRLAAEGLLERLPGGGCRVARFDFDEIRDAIELRGVMEGTAARLAAERGADPALLAEADDILIAIDRCLGTGHAIDFDAYTRLNAQFHDMIARLSGSALVKREVERICRLPLASPSAFLRGQEVIPDFMASLVRAQSQHRAIVEAIRDREGSRAEALAREHARLARQNLAFFKTADRRLANRVPGLSLVTAT